MTCSMEIKLKKEVSGTESKSDIAASLKASYESISYSVSASVGYSNSKEKKKSSENVTVSVEYKGNNNE